MARADRDGRGSHRQSFRQKTLLPLDDVLAVCAIPSPTSVAVRYTLPSLDDGQAERMNRTIKDATVKAYSHDDLESLD
ncbi:hypothetical protein [Shinella sp.]|jgi:hypothetical protein|uniref:hypothetical protein n=1 Tax=Shinella sp. TaxID=1870904 RepID=UPI0039C907FD